MVEKSWTFEQARAADKEVVEKRNDRRSRPTDPLDQWLALQELDVLKAQYEAGNRSALAFAIRTCMVHELIPPSWVKERFVEGLYAVRHYKARSWDYVFGSPHPKGIRLADAKRKFSLTPAIANRISDLIDRGSPVDEALFEQVAAEFNIGKRQCSEWYYEHKKWFDRSFPRKIKNSG